MSDEGTAELQGHVQGHADVTQGRSVDGSGHALGHDQGVIEDRGGGRISCIRQSCEV